jgi:hypothetical protein
MAALALGEVQSLASAGQARVVAELDARGVCPDAEFGLSTASWLAREAMLPGRVAREQVKVGGRLRDLLPEVGEAVVDGRITSHHAAVLAGACHDRVADGIVALQADLVALAGNTSFDRWRSRARASSSCSMRTAATIPPATWPAIS